MEPALTTSPVSVEYRDLVADGPMVPQEDLRLRTDDCSGGPSCGAWR